MAGSDRHRRVTPPGQAAEVAARERARELVRRGYDEISWAYRADDGRAHPLSGEDTRRYDGWIADLATLLPPRALVVDLGCGAGVPATRALAGHGLRVIGVDFSGVQLRRARGQLVRFGPGPTG